MGDWPSLAVPPVHIHTFTRYSSVDALRNMTGSLTVAAMAWPSANRVIYCPFALPFRYQVSRLWWVNGSTAGGNWIVGIYANDGTGRKLGTDTGAIAGSGASVPQYAAPTGGAFFLDPGAYYWGIIMSITTASRATGAVNATVPRMRMAGFLQEDPGSNTLPATMTPAAITAVGTVPYVGMTYTTTGF